MTHRIAVRCADVVSADGHLGLPLASLRSYLLAATSPVRGADVIASPVDEFADRSIGQGHLAQESDCGAGGDHVGEVLLGVGGNPYHGWRCRRPGSVKLLSDVEPARFRG